MITAQTKSRQQIRYSKRSEKKTIKKLEKAETDTAFKIKNLLKQVFLEDELSEIALKTKFLSRTRKLTPFAIIAILLMGCLNGTEDVATLEIMCCFLRKWFSIDVKAQSLQEKLNTKQCADFIKAISIKVMMHEANKVIAKLVKKPRKTNLFYRVLLQDSTVISLPETVSRMFRGCGGSASKAAVKCDLIIDQSNHLIVRCKCISGRIPDVSLSEDILKFSQEDDLIIRDMGYFNLSHFTLMNKKKVKFITRLKSCVHVFLNKDDENPINLIKYLNELKIKKNKIDIDVYLGKKEKIHVRLIGLKVPAEVVNTRRNQYIQAHGRRKTPSEDLLAWYEYTLMVTNISREVLSLKLILNLYKIRWQIELFFKNMKSQLKVDNFTGENKYRILCLLYSKLVLTWIIALLFAVAQNISGNKYIISPIKFTRWLRDVGDWQKIVIEKDFTELIKAYKRDMNLLKKSVKRKTF